MRIKSLKLLVPILLLCFIGTIGQGCKGIETKGSPKISTKVSIKGDNNKTVVFIPTGPNGEKLDNSFNCQKFLGEYFPVLSRLLSEQEMPIQEVAVQIQQPQSVSTICMVFGSFNMNERGRTKSVFGSFAER